MEAHSITSLTNETAALYEEILSTGLNLRLQVTGKSMAPFLCGGEILTIRKVLSRDLQPGDLIFFRTRYGSLLLHRIMTKKYIGSTHVFQTKGDALIAFDEPVAEDAILGKVCMVEKTSTSGKTKQIDMELPYWRTAHYLIALKGLLRSKASFALSKIPLYTSFRSLIK